jgi:hypothetical protein
MPITLQQAQALHFGQIVHADNERNADGTCKRWRIAGKTKYWKRNPNRIKIPIARGLYEHGYITETNINSIHLEHECKNPKGY